MEPEEPNKKHDTWFASWNYNFTMPINSYNIPQYKKETVEEMITRLDEADAVIDAMTSYPTAEKLLNKLYGKA
jgi:hypothetical protein